MSNVLPVVGNILDSHRKAMRIHLVCFFGALGLGLALLVIVLLSGMGSDSLLPKLASGFVMVLAAPPLALVLKRRDRVTALRAIEQTMSRAVPGSEEARRCEEIAWKALESMATG